MKTDDLITLIAHDAGLRVRYSRFLGIALTVGVACSAISLIAIIGPRKDMTTALETVRVCFKVVVTIVLAVLATRLANRIGRPGAATRRPALLLMLPFLMVAGAVVAELIALPQAAWKTSMMGRNALSCLLLLPTLSLAPLVGLLWALRQGAPENPTSAGAVAGLAAGAVASAIYAWHCPDDSPLFLATWYTMAIAMVTGTGALLGRRLLRW